MRRNDDSHSSDSRSWISWISWGVLLLVVGGLLAWLLARFTGSVLLSSCLIMFMLAYMLIMGYWAMRDHNRS